MAEVKMRKSGLPDGYSGQAVDLGTIYECDNPRCTLARVGTTGHFTGGLAFGLEGEAARDEARNVTGDPDSATGEGICPNCGEPGKDTGEKHLSNVADGDEPSIHEPKAGHTPVVHTKEVG